MEVLTNRLKEVRANKEVTQKEVAAKIGVHFLRYMEFENGEREPRMDELASICKYYGVSADWLIGLTDQK